MREAVITRKQEEKMSTQTKSGWEQGLLAEVLGAIRTSANGRINDVGPDRVMSKADFARIKNVLDEAKASFELEYGDKVNNKTLGMWPFTDDSIKLPPKFEAVFMEVYDYYKLYPYSDDEIKAKIEKAGGRPYNHWGYGKGDYGDLVVEPDVKMIAAKLGCAPKTVRRELNKMVEAGILFELKTARNKPSMYVIGTLGKMPPNMHKRNPFINRRDRREGIKAVLEQL